MKLYIKKIESCTQCPSCVYDNNITRWECEKRGNEFLKWMGDDDKIEIPKWCPLINADVLEKGDFEI